MTASFRGTPSFTPVPTQNTAPVHEFRALYTHDLYKKKKTWHDGSLRFHTFNRRVMLYDDGKNYIGDYHCRQDEDVYEGSELRLDKGILVDVGERLGETQTDLTPLLDRRKEDASPQPARRIQLVASASQSTSKKLSQILPSQTRMGRARPIISPYEGRQALVPTQPTESSMPPPPKRQKISSSGKENRLATARPTPEVSEKPTPKTFTRPEPRRPAPVRPQTVDFQEVLDLSSDEEIAKSAKRQAPKTTKAGKKDAKRKDKAEIIDKIPVKERQPTKQVSKPAKPTQISEPNMETRNDSTSFETVQKRTEVRDADVERPSSRTQPASSRSAISQTGTSSKPGTTQLRFRNQKPKRKLMYRALLPSSRHTQTPSGDSSSRASVERASAVFYDIDPQLSLIPDAPDQRLPVITPSSRRGSVDEPVEVPSSPLVVPQDGHVESPVRSPRSSQDGLEARMIGSPDTPETTSPVSKHGPEINSDQMCSLPRSIPNSAVAMPPPKLMPSKPAQMLPPPPAWFHSPQRIFQSTARSRPFRRVRSENDAYEGVEDEFPDLGLSALPPPSFLAKAQPSPIRPCRSPAKAPAKLRRTASDSAVMEEGVEPVTGYNIQPIQESNGEIGPWTSTEAFLLFELWPPGRTKPFCDVPSYADVNTGQSFLGKPTITTARDLLRDELNVL